MREISDQEILCIIGANIRARRKRAGLSQKAVGETLGVSFQQLQKYENGTNRIPALYLVRLAVLFQCLAADFYGGIGTAPAAPIEDDSPTRMQEHRLMRAIQAIPSQKVRQRALALVEALGGVAA